MYLVGLVDLNLNLIAFINHSVFNALLVCTIQCKTLVISSAPVRIKVNQLRLVNNHNNNDLSIINTAFQLLMAAYLLYRSLDNLSYINI